MSVQIPDPRFEAPELLDPGRKPVGNVVIDWEHPLTNKLQNLIMLNGNRMQNMFNGDTPIITGTMETDHRGIYDDSSYGSISTAVFNNLNVDYLNVSRASYSVFTKFTFVSFIGANPAYVYSAGSVSNRLTLTIQQDNIVHFRVPVTNNVSISFSVANLSDYLDGKEHSICVTGDIERSTNTTQTLYIDGEKIDEQVINVWGDATWTGYDNIAIASVPFTYSVSGVYVPYWSIFAGILSANEVRALHNNPYQFLIPA